VLSFLRRNVIHCPPNAKAFAYKTLVRPKLEYAACSWDPYTTQQIYSLKMVQRRAARFVNRNYRRTSSVTSMMSELEWESLQSQRKVSRPSLFAIAMHGAVAISLDGVVRQNRSTRCTGSDEAPIFQQISTHCNTFKYSFIPRTVVDWNQLPSEIRCKSSNLSFRDILSDYFSTNCY